MPLKNSFHFLFSLLLISLPFSKALASIAFVGLILISIWIFYRKKNLPIRKNGLLILPIFIFLSLFISLFYSDDWHSGLKVLSSQFDFIAIPFIFLAGQLLIKKRFVAYCKMFIYATSVASLITFILFWLPETLMIEITTAISLLKDYVVHEKRWAFGAYSPFIDRLQFSYLLAIAFFLQLWLLFTKYPKTKKNDIHLNRLELSRYLILFLLLATLLVLGARGAQMSFLVGLIVWIIAAYFYFLHPILEKKINRFFSYGLLVGSLLFFTIIAPYLAYKNIPAVQMRYNQLVWELQTFRDGTFKNYNYTHFTSLRRLFSWKNNWQLIKKQALTGVGIGDYKKEMLREYERDNLGFPVNTQSQFLYYWASAGLFALACLLALLVGGLMCFLKQKDYWLKALAITFFCFYFLVFLMDAPLNFQVGGMSFLVLYSLLVTKLTSTFSQ